MANTKDTPSDTLVMGDVVNDAGDRSCIVFKGDQVTRTTLHFLKEGEDAGPDYVRVSLTHRQGNVYDYKESETVAMSPPIEGGNRPAMVNSKAYLNGWDTIFGKQPVGQA